MIFNHVCAWRELVQFSIMCGKVNFGELPWFAMVGQNTGGKF